MTLPNPTDEMQPFWDGLQRGEFLLLRCRRCGSWRWPMAGCRHHSNEPYLENMAWTPASGRGTVLSFTVQRVQHAPAFPVPYVYAVVALDEGPVMGTNIVNCPPESVHVGLPVRVTVRAISDQYALPLFEPASPGAPSEGRHA